MATQTSNGGTSSEFNYLRQELRRLDKQYGELETKLGLRPPQDSPKFTPNLPQIINAVGNIEKDNAKRVDINENISVYRAGKIIRIDIKS